MRNFLFLFVASLGFLLVCSCSDEGLNNLAQDDLSTQTLETRAPNVEIRDVDYVKCLSSNSECNDYLYRLNIEICSDDLEVFHLYANTCGSTSSTWQYLGIPQVVNASLGLYYIEQCASIFPQGAIGVPSNDIILLPDVSSSYNVNQGVPPTCDGNSTCNAYYEMSPSATIVQCL